MFKVLRIELLRYMLHTCPNCDVTCAQSATQWTASVHTLHTLHTSRNLGWGAMTCTLLAHIFDATQVYLRTCSMLRNCTCVHVRCYAIALGHMFDATQLHLGTCSMLRNCTSRREGQAMDMACWSLACEPAFVQAAVPQTLSKGVLKKCETN